MTTAVHTFENLFDLIAEGNAIAVIAIILLAGFLLIAFGGRK